MPGPHDIEATHCVGKASAEVSSVEQRVVYEKASTQQWPAAFGILPRLASCVVHRLLVLRIILSWVEQS